MIEISRESKRSTYFKYDNLCMFAGIKQDGGNFPDIVIEEKEKKYNLNYLLKKDQIVRSHMEADTRFKEEVVFCILQHLKLEEYWLILIAKRKQNQ